MNTADWAFILVLAVVTVAAAVCGIAWKVAYNDGREAGALNERNTRNEGRLSGRVNRATGEIWGTEPDQFDDWLKNLTGDGERLASTGELRQLTAYHPAGGRTVTGAFRAITDQYIEQMQAEEDHYREGLAS